MPDLRVFVLLIFYLLFVSGLFTAIINDKENLDYKAISIGTYTGSLSNVQNYSVNNSYYEDTLVVNGFITNGVWKRIENIGIRLDSIGFGQSRLCVENLVPLNGIYEVIYYINNSVHKPFSIYPQYVETGEMIEIYFDTIGYHQPSYWFKLPSLGDNYFKPDTSLMSKDFLTLKTIFDTNKKSLILFNDDTQIFEIKEGLNLPWDINTVYYAGVGSNTVGFAIQRIDARISETPIESNTNVFSFISLLFKIMFWSIDEAYLPLSLNILIIKFPLFIVFVFGVLIARGV